MTAKECLDALRDFIEENVASDILLLKEGTENEYVNPKVYLMTLPHKNFVPVDFTVPYILIGLADGSDGADENELSIRIICATYSSGIYDEEIKMPDETGYVDLLNLIEKIKLKLVEEMVIGGKGKVEKPINYGIYSEQITYPYSYGYLTFKMQIPINEYPFNKLFQ